MHNNRYRLNSLLLLVAGLITMGCGQAQSNGTHKSSRYDDSLALVAIDSSYDFIRYDTNRLWIGSDSSHMQHFADKWFQFLATGEGQLNILQIGASHIQGGTFPHRVRCNLLRTVQQAGVPSPIGSRGLIFPYSAAKGCNNPYDYKVRRSRDLLLTRNVYREPDCQLGLCGIAVTAADDTADINIMMNEPDFDFATTRILLMGIAKGGVVPYLHIVAADSSETLVMPQQVDTALRQYCYQMPAAVDSFHVVLPCKEGQSFSITGLYLYNDQPGLTFHSIGVNGASTVDYLNKCPYFTTDLKLVQPDLAIFCIGINDASGSNFDTTVFYNRYQRLIDSVRSVSPDCALLFVTNNDSSRRIRRRYSTNENAVLAREVFLRLAEANGGAVWDQFTIMGGLGSMGKWQAADLAQRDHIHFTRKGYTMLGDLLTNALYDMLNHMNPSLSKR